MNYKKRLFLLSTFLFMLSLSHLYAQSKGYKRLKNILKKSTKKIISIKSASYYASYKSDDERDSGPPLIINGTVFLKKLSEEDELGVKTKIKAQWINPEEIFKAIYYYNGHKEITVVPLQKRIHIFNHPAILTGNVVGNLVQTILISGNPFGNTLDRMADFEMKESQIIGGEPCYVFTLYFPDNEYLKNLNDTWYISKNDYLPRKHVDRYTYNGKKSVTTLQFEDFNINPELPDSLFTLSSFPKGYEIKRPEDRAAKKKPELLEVGSKAPGWTLKNGHGEDISLHDYCGQIVILDFWGTWCPPCLKAMPELQRIHDKYDEVTVLGASTNEPTNAEPEKFAQNQDINYPIVLNGEKIIEDYHVQAFPTFYIIGKDGSIIYRAAGYGDGTGKKVEEVLKEKL